MRCVICSNRAWQRKAAEDLANMTGAEVEYIGDPAALTLEYLREINPRYVFFPHWSEIIPAEIYENFECVIFHMTDLPFGRGGSPLQNLIARGIYETKISALRCIAGLDAGPVYLKRPLSLWGSAEEIFIRGRDICVDMMAEIIKEQIVPQPQEGTPTVFRRRRPEDGDIARLSSLPEVFDYIRMLDADGYPAAFLETERLRLEFRRAALRDGCIEADVRITFKGDGQA